MTTASDKIQASLDALEARTDIPRDILDRQRELYTKIDALDGATRRLLIQNTLSEAKGALSVASEEISDPVAIQGLVIYVDSLLAMAGYAGQTLRDEAQETSTGDSRATDVMEHLRGLIADTAKAQLALAGLDTGGNPLGGPSKEAVLVKDNPLNDQRSTDDGYGVYL